MSFLHDPFFKQIQDALDVKMKEGTAKGLGHKKQADIFTPQSEEELWSTGTLGSDEPKQLLHTIMYVLGKHFALRAAEHRDLSVHQEITVIFPFHVFNCCYIPFFYHVFKFFYLITLLFFIY